MSEVQETRQATKPRPSAGLMHSFSLFVLLPSLVGAIYFGLIASDRYVAEARYAIRTGSQAPMGGFIESIVTSGLGGNTRQDAEIVRSFVLSLDMLEQLGRRFDLRAHYESSEIDWLSRLDPAASEEDFLEYFEDRIEVTIDPESGISTLRVHAPGDF